jgi:GNAT superfamily N-acetyltransferase
MIIRTVEPKDFESWSLLWDQYNLFYKRSIPSEITSTTWKRFLDPNEQVFALVAEIDGKVIGFTTFLYHRHTALINDVCYLQDLFTEVTYSGKGTGKALIRAVSERAKERGTIQVYWMTHESNEAGRNLYDKLAKHSGFIVYSKRT